MIPTYQQIFNNFVISTRAGHYTLPEIILDIVNFVMPLPYLWFHVYVFIIQAYYFITSFYTPIICSLLFLIELYILIRLIIFKRSLATKKVILQIIPPDTVTKSPLATNEFFNALHDIGRGSNTFLYIFHMKWVYSLEIVATKEDGIRYAIQLPEEDENVVTKAVLSYVPNAKIIKIDDYLPIQHNTLQLNCQWKISEFIFSNEFIFSLNTDQVLEKHDLIAYLTGHMTKLQSPDDIILFQINVTPLTNQVHSKLIKKINHILEAVDTSCDITPFVKKPLLKTLITFPFKVLIYSLLFIIGFLFWQINLLLFIITLGGVKMLIVEIFRQRYQKVNLLPNHRKHYDAIGDKLSQNLFETTIRLFIASQNRKEVTTRERGIKSGLAALTNPGYQSIQYKQTFPIVFHKISEVISLFRLKHRILSIKDNPILSASEVASLYHLPFTPTTKTEDLVKDKTKTLPAPLPFKKFNYPMDVTFGVNIHNGEEINVGLTFEERKRHMYILGATGTGKSTLLSTMIYQDIQNGKGLCVIDPHGDLTQSILGTVPRRRIEDVVYFNPTDRKYPVGLNILELPKNLTEEQLQEEKDIITSSIISVFHKLYTAKYFGPRMENILRYAILFALETENPTLFTIQKILTDKKFRNKLIPKITDPVVKDFWLHEFKRLGSYQQAEVTSPITNKIGQFLASSLCRNILGQTKSTIDFEKILNEGKILICSIPKGSIGEDNSAFFGVLVTAKIQLAALRRVRIPEKKRRDFYLYIDEFQNFATDSFAQILSEARKYGLSAILAHQTIAQLTDNNLTKVILANTGTVICFRTSSPLDEDYILPIFAPLVDEGEIGNLPSFSFYCKISALKPNDTFSGKTEPFTQKSNKKMVDTITAYSQKTYGVERKKVEEDIKQFYLSQPQIDNNQKQHESDSVMT